MALRIARLSCALWLAAAVGACSKSPTQPSTTVSTPTVVLPANGAQVRYVDQPVTLVVQNAVVAGGSGSPTYSFEVATDAGFATKVFTRDGIAQGGSGQTSLTIDTLGAGKDYFWHARATSGGTVGSYGSTNKFTVGPAVSIDAPTPVSPANGTTVNSWPTFIVNNANHNGAIGPIMYRFDVSVDGSFLGIVLSQSVPEGVGQTRLVPAVTSAPPSGTLYWHATVIDQGSSISSNPSTAQTFSYSGSGGGGTGQPLWTGIQPPGTNGHATLGDNWNSETTSNPVCGPHVKPTLEELRVFDLLDRGMDPQGALNWMNANGYSTQAAYYPGPLVIGFSCEYMALINGRWDLVNRAGA